MVDIWTKVRGEVVPVEEKEAKKKEKKKTRKSKRLTFKQACVKLNEYLSRGDFALAYGRFGGGGEFSMVPERCRGKRVALGTSTFRYESFNDLLGECKECYPKLFEVW